MSFKREAYISDVPTVKENPNWRNLIKLKLVGSVEELKEIQAQFMSAPKLLAVDSETTSLTISKADMVGFSFAFKPNEAYYIPLQHKIGNNLPLEECVEILKQMMYVAEKVLFYNYRFDMGILRKYGVDKSKLSEFDVMCLVWNVDCNINMPGLKESSLKYLGIRQTSFEDLFPNSDDLDFSYLDPNQCYDYAAADAICTLLLYIVLNKAFVEKFGDFIVNLDSALEKAMMFYEDSEILVDLDYARSQAVIAEQELKRLEGEVFAMTGTHFDINSPAQLAEVLLAMGVPLGTTKRGAPSTREDVIGKLAGQYPIVDKVLEFRGVQKELSTYIMPFINNGKDTVRIHYFTCAAPTGRLASGGSKKRKDPDFLPLNIQSMPKPNPWYFKPVEDPNGILGWRFEPSPDGKRSKEYYFEGMEPNNVRRIFKAEEGHYIVGIDFASEELVICANISGDPNFIEPLVNGEDLHYATAVKMFGEENYDEYKRKIAKILNYACLYGGWAGTIHQQMPEKSMEECEAYHQMWKKAHAGWIEYCNSSSRYAKKTGYIKSLMGRVRRVAYWFNSKIRRDWSFADRTVANTQVQGLAADIMRYVMVRLANEVFPKAEYEGKIKFKASMHDELVFSVIKDPAEFTKIVDKVVHIITDLPFSGWRKPLEAEVEVGDTWGSKFAFKKVDGKWVPNG